jgi:hypothetical protein
MKNEKKNRLDEDCSDLVCRLYSKSDTSPTAINANVQKIVLFVAFVSRYSAVLPLTTGEFHSFSQNGNSESRPHSSASLTENLFSTAESNYRHWHAILLLANQT